MIVMIVVVIHIILLLIGVHLYHIDDFFRVIKFKLVDICVYFFNFIINECTDDEKKQRRICILVIICDDTELQQRTIFYVSVLCVTAARVFYACFFFLKKLKNTKKKIK